MPTGWRLPPRDMLFQWEFYPVEATFFLLLSSKAPKLKAILETGAEQLRAKGYRVVTLNFVVPLDSLKFHDEMPAGVKNILFRIGREIRTIFSGVVHRKYKKHKKMKHGEKKT
jgi:hypothetical protein